MSEYQSTFSIPGVASQIDWGAMADKLMEKARKPQTQWVAQRDTLELKIGLFNEFSASMKTMRQAVTPLKLESVYNAKAVEFSALGGADASAIVTATADASASIARHEIEVIQKAVAESRFSAKIEKTMADAGLPGTRTFCIHVGGRSAEIVVNVTDSLSTIADKINTAKDATIDPATGKPYDEALGVVATVVDNRLVLRSSKTGLGTTTTDWEIVRGTTTSDRLGFTVAKGAPSNGTLSITAGSVTYQEGVDFTVESGSDKIVWKDTGAAPAAGVKYTVSYTVNSHAFSMTGDGELLHILKFDDPVPPTPDDDDYHIKAKDAIFKIDGLAVTRSSNQIDDLLEGVKLTINGPGSVIMDITQDAEKAVSGVEEFMASYNEVIDWINVRLTESKQEKSDDYMRNEDFYKKFGLLHGNSMLWQSKSQLRTLMTNPVDAKYSKKTGNAVLGTMASQGLTTNSTFELTVGVRTARIEVTPSDTLSSIASKINNSYEMLHDPQGRVYPIPMASAKVVDNQLVIEASPNRKFSLKASDDILNTLGLGTPFSLLSQLGISTEKEDFGKSGKLEFNTEKFMEAMRKDPEGVGAIMTSVMTSMDEYIGNMVDASQVEIGDTTVPKGRIASQIYTYRSEITIINKRISDFERRLEVRARGLYERFTQAEVRLARLQQQSSMLASALDQLKKTTGG